MSRQASVHRAIEIVPSGDACGAEVRGLDLAVPLCDAPAATVLGALVEHGVLVFRGQRISERQQIAFTAALGVPDSYTLGEYRAAAHPEILLVSNIRENGRNIGLADAGTTWHTDSSYLAIPPLATVLYALEVPERDGRVLGDTLFASAAAAYDALDPAEQARLEGLTAVHSYHAKHRARAALGRSDRNRPSADEEKALAPVEHPVVRRHPHSGRKALYVTAGECTGILGMDDDAARTLIETLAAHAVDPRFQHRHRWRAGDLVVWDNCQVQHLATKDYDLPLRRLMHRTQVKGTRPV